MVKTETLKTVFETHKLFCQPQLTLVHWCLTLRQQLNNKWRGRGDWVELKRKNLNKNFKKHNQNKCLWSILTMLIKTMAICHKNDLVERSKTAMSVCVCVCVMVMLIKDDQGMVEAQERKKHDQTEWARNLLLFVVGWMNQILGKLCAEGRERECLDDVLQRWQGGQLELWKSCKQWEKIKFGKFYWI